MSDRPPNAQVVLAPDDAAVVATVNEIKQRPGRDLGLPGGVRTARTFARLGLIDRYVLLVEPVALGDGERLFDQSTALTRIDAKTHDCGIIELAYQPAR